MVKKLSFNTPLNIPPIRHTSQNIGSGSDQTGQNSTEFFDRKQFLCNSLDPSVFSQAFLCIMPCLDLFLVIETPSYTQVKTN